MLTLTGYERVIGQSVRALDKTIKTYCTMTTVLFGYSLFMHHEHGTKHSKNDTKKKMKKLMFKVNVLMNYNQRFEENFLSYNVSSHTKCKNIKRMILN